MNVPLIESMELVRNDIWETDPYLVMIRGEVDRIRSYFQSEVDRRPHITNAELAMLDREYRATVEPFIKMAVKYSMTMPSPHLALVKKTGEDCTKTAPMEPTC